ncbi:TraB/GumN family protein [Salibaculum griseiflavum]|nr:TraB/GumN family protein [Salibaculum griseiflavum]
MLRPVLGMIFALLSGAAAAECAGPGLESRLDPSEIARIETLVAETPFAEGLVWHAERDGAELTLLGTIHLPDPRLGLVLHEVRGRLDRADLLLVEATAEDQLALQAHIAGDPTQFTITEGPNLIDRLDPETWQAVSRAAEARGVPPFMAARMQPWFLSMTLAMPPCAAFAMAEGQAGLDNLILSELDDRIEIRALEDWRVVLDLLRQGSFEEQLEALRVGLMDPAVMDALVVSMLEGYFERRPAYSWHINRAAGGFAPGLGAEAFEAQMQEMEQTLLFDRNRDWIPVIEAAAREHDKVFVAFGAAHLIGEKGVLALLQDNGWALTRLDD